MMLLGIDGGGTATALCLADGDGRVLAVDFRSAVNPAGTHGSPADVLGRGVRTLCDGVGIDAAAIDGAYVALPYVGEDRAYTTGLHTAVASALGHERFEIGNDMVAGWAGSLAGEDGVNVIAGTGSMAFGVRGQHRVRVGGWGPPFGDEGSGWAIANAGLQAFTMMADGRHTRGPLYDAIRTALALEQDLDLAGRFARSDVELRGAVASLAPLVFDAAAAGDTAAQVIVDSAAQSLSDCTAVVIDRLSWAPDDPVPVSYSGGVFAAPAFAALFASFLARRRPTARVVTPVLPPVLGAVLLAARVAGQTDHAALVAGLQEARLPSKTAGMTRSAARHGWVTAG